MFLPELEEYVDDEGVRWVRDRKRPPVSLMNHYNCTWKAQNNHFQKYSDVKVKGERWILQGYSEPQCHAKTLATELDVLVID